MRTLTNDHHDFLLINLGLATNGRGPYAIRQDGVPPGSISQQEDRFYLGKDGTWKLNFLVYLEESTIDEFLFESIAEVHQCVLSLVGKPSVRGELPDGTTKTDVLTAIERVSNRFAQAMQQNKATRYNNNA